MMVAHLQNILENFFEKLLELIIIVLKNQCKINSLHSRIFVFYNSK